MSIIIGGDILQNIVCGISGVSLTDRRDIYFHEPTGVNYSIYRYLGSTVQIREVSGSHTLPVYIELGGMWDIHDIRKLIEFILLRKFNRYSL